MMKIQFVLEGMFIDRDGPPCPRCGYREGKYSHIEGGYRYECPRCEQTYQVLIAISQEDEQP
jgi:transposase-like protein